ncbi:MAG: diaminopropionate ammonia-lyase [Planctomycetaceae bacterium]|nr:diaminopropionate ammonia-lyase [Planctomycetaceae bacterium]
MPNQPGCPISIKRHISNPRAIVREACPHDVEGILPAHERRGACETIRRWEGYHPTELRSLSEIASEFGIAHVFYKDESDRFEPRSFKSLGGAYAVQSLLASEIARELGRSVTLEDIRLGKHSDRARRITVATATDGNHGRSVAWGAQRFGCECVVFMHEKVSQGRQEAVEVYGARVVRVKGNYDDSVRAAADAASSAGWFVVSDTSWPGYEAVPRIVMAGYALMSAETREQWPVASPPTHVFLQGGVGGMAAAVCVDLWARYGADRPRLVLVEPESAACLLESVASGGRVDVDVEIETLMAGLSCGEVSTLAWPVIDQGIDDLLAIGDEMVGPLMERLDRESGIEAGESAVAGLAGLMGAMEDPELAGQLGLSDQSRVLLFGTEGATDPAIHRRLIEEVRGSGDQG